VLRRTLEAVYLVSAAGGPLGGDRLELRISVASGAMLRLRTVAASVAQPGLDGGESVLTIRATVESGGRLEYLPEPVVVADNARHATDVTVALADGASLLLRDELILGRHGERGGAYRHSLRVDYAGHPLLRQSLDVSGTDEASRGPAILSGHRAVGTVLHADPALEPPKSPRANESVAVMPLADGTAVLVTALANDAVALRQLLLSPRGEPPYPRLELGLKVLDLAGASADLLVGRPLTDARQRPADGLGAAARDPDRDERVQGL